MQGLLLSLLFLGLSTGFSLEFTHITSTQKQEFKSQFEQAKSLNYLDGSWACDMFGVRSGSAKLHQARLLDLHRDENEFRNKGSHVIKSYSIINGEFYGEAVGVTEIIRQLTTSTIITKLVDKTTDEVVSYSVCQRS